MRETRKEKVNKQKKFKNKEGTKQKQTSKSNSTKPETLTRLRNEYQTKMTFPLALHRSVEARRPVKESPLKVNKINLNKTANKRFYLCIRLGQSTRLCSQW